MSRTECEALTTLVLILVFAAVLGVLGQALDEHSEHTSRARDARRELVADNTLGDSRLRRDLAAAAYCRQVHGEAGFTWTAAGKLACIPRRGKQVFASNF